jgi:hypothetical protein
MILNDVEIAPRLRSRGPAAGCMTFPPLRGAHEARHQKVGLSAGPRVAQDERGKGLRVPFLRRAVGATAEDQLDERLVDIWCQHPKEPLPGLPALMAQQHVREFVDSDVCGVEGRGSSLVVDVIGARTADPHAARAPWPKAERAEPDRALPLPFQPDHELA